MIFEENIRVLREVDTELASLIISADKSEDLHVVTSRSGAPSLRAGGVTLHSLYNPAKEGGEWVKYNKEDIEKGTSLVVFGFGLSYHIIELLKITEKDIFVFEPRVDILKTAFEHIDLSSILSRVRIIISDKIPKISRGFAILEYNPSTNLSRGYYDHIRARLKALQKVRRGIKIMVVSPIYGGSYPVAKFCERALINLGHKVDFLDNGIYNDALLSIDQITTNKAHQDQLKEMLINFVSEAVIARCNESMPDLILSLAQAPLSIYSLQKLKDNKVPTALWFVEDFRVQKYWQDVAPLYDYLFTIQRGEFFERLRDRGVKNFCYLPLAASMVAHKEIGLTAEELESYGSDISFVGAGYRNRRKFFEGLLDLDFKIWGNEWDLNTPIGRCIQRSGERIETEETVKIFNAAKININLHSSPYHDGVNPYGDFVNPRTFEIAACGGFQLVDYRSELPDLVEIDKEIVCFRGIDDLRQKIKYYLDNPGKRKEIALTGKERVLREHTYEQRMKAMMDFIIESGYEPPVWKRDTQDVETLIDAAKGNGELVEYLMRFSKKSDIGLGDIIGEIQKGDGDLTRVEKIFLLMNSLKKDYSKKG